MKVIKYTNQHFNEFGTRTHTEIHYEDGTSRIALPNEERTKENTREFMFYTIKRLQEKWNTQNTPKEDK